MLGAIKIPSGALLKGRAKFQGVRLELTISSIEYQESIYPEISIYDNDGQSGMHIPYLPEQFALNDIAANMEQSSGTNIMITQAAGRLPLI
ncbi:conjugative transposon protein TraM [Chryseobacterium sp. CBSDS_008]|uniref:conjugative transposon protein TraM n=1 Tax=Chryseobacterium sp. CBSDS_008 TaxID=3415265 RepID=UPI003CED123B